MIVAGGFYQAVVAACMIRGVVAEIEITGGVASGAAATPPEGSGL
jgi:hypothetical protein